MEHIAPLQPGSVFKSGTFMQGEHSVEIQLRSISGNLHDLFSLLVNGVFYIYNTWYILEIFLCNVSSFQYSVILRKEMEITLQKFTTCFVCSVYIMFMKKLKGN